MGLFSRVLRKQSPTASTRLGAVLFDTFGTTVDWRGSMTAHGQKLGAKTGVNADWEGLANEWRAHYKPAIKPVREGRRKWTGFDTLHREELDKIAGRFGAKKLSSADRDWLTRGWHYLAAWPDVVSALTRLKKSYTIGPLSNGTTRQMVDLAKWSGLPWDLVFGADMFQTYKPDPKLYLAAAKCLEFQPAEILLVAAHNEDLQAAAEVGFRTCFVYRKTEDLKPTGKYDFVVDDFEHLARMLAPA